MSLRILVAHNVPRRRNRRHEPNHGVHSRPGRPAGRAIEEFTADDAPWYARGRWARFGFPLAVLHHVRVAARAGQPFDIVNIHEPAAWAMVLFRGWAVRPKVVTSHGLEQRGWDLSLEEGRLGRGGPSLKTRLTFPPTLLWPAKWALRHADDVFCLNSEDRDFLCRRYGRLERDITRIYPAANEVFAEAAAKRDYLRGDRLLFAATWRHNKGKADLIPAFVELAHRYPALKLTVLGPGVPAAVVTGAFPSDIRQRVDVIQVSSEAETAAAFASADLFLLPSLFEGTPLTLMEAMASGLPIITTATCGMKDVIRAGVNGLLLPIRSPAAIVTAVDRLLKSAELRAELSRAAQAEALAHYTWDQKATAVVVAYERLAASDTLIEESAGNAKGEGKQQPQVCEVSRS